MLFCPIYDNFTKDNVLFLCNGCFNLCFTTILFGILLPSFSAGLGTFPLDSVGLCQENETRTSVHYFMKRIQDIKVYNMVKKRRTEPEFLKIEGVQELKVSLFYPVW